MKNTWGWGLVLLALSLPLAAWIATQDAGAPAPAKSVSAASATGTNREIARLEDALEIERDARRALGERVAILEELLDESEVEVKAPRPVQASRMPVRSQLLAAASGFRAALLEGLGVSAADSERLREHWNQWELDRLYLNHEATRQNSLRTPRHREQLREIRDALQRDLGDEDFDRLLYASGQPNRVIVRSTLGDSPALDAGLQPGDSIMAYDGQRVFQPAELKLLTTHGKPGESTAIDVERDGQLFRFYLPRGPIGVHLQASRVAPRQP